DLGAYESNAIVAINKNRPDLVYTNIQAAIDAGRNGETIELVNSRITSEFFGTHGGVITVDKSLNIVGNGATLDAEGKSGIIRINDGNNNSVISVGIQNITLINGAAALGGAINNAENLLLNNVKLTNNTATVAGGAIYNNGGNIFINYSTIANNRSNGNGGAINSLKGNVEIYYSTLSHNQSRGNGGAINVENGSLSVNASTLSHNLAQGDGGAIAAYNSSLLSDSNTLAYTGAANGGAIYANGGKVTVFGNTIAFNHVAEFGSGSGLYIGDGTSYSVMRTLAVFNHANGSYGEDVYVTMRASGIIEDSIYIYLGDETPIGEDVEFFPGAYYLDSDIFTSEFLHDNGGWTQTLALAVNSLARDYGDPDNKSEVDEFDQRGYMRDGSYDIGAFEYAGAIGKVYSDANKSDNGTTIIYISSLEDLNDI
ncbi:MAG: choice-of-anchor Q domain-containing protein, partial [Victivallaceae bacterium]